MNPNFLGLLAALSYFAGGFTTGLRLFAGPDDWRPQRNLGLGLGFLGLLFHGLLLFQGTFLPEGINIGFFNTASLVAWFVVLLLMLAAINQPVENLAIALLPLAAIVLLLAVHNPQVHLLGTDTPRGLGMHIMVSLLAYSLLTLASVQAILLALQHRHLHNRQPGGFVRMLPPLQTMEKLLFQMIAVGFVLLSLSLLSGFAFLEDMFAQHLAHKTLLSVLAWSVFGGLLFGRMRYGWRGRVAIRWTLLGFVVLMLAYFGSKAVLELILER